MPDYTPHQKKIISRYYDHKDEILLNRLQEIVTDLFLAQKESQQKRLWDRAAKAMAGLKVPATISQHILETRKPDVLAKKLAQWLKSPPLSAHQPPANPPLADQSRANQSCANQSRANQSRRPES